MVLIPVEFLLAQTSVGIRTWETSGTAIGGERERSFCIFFFSQWDVEDPASHIEY
jgi:hypothetical protein